MNTLEIEKMAKLENEYWWHVGKRHLVEALFDKYQPGQNDLHILEIGCGTGGLTEILRNYGKVTGFDISPAAVNFCKSRGLEDVHVKDLTAMDVAEYRDKYDLVLAMDVLEHIQDDLEVMQKVMAMLKPSGLFFVNVPAHKFLWSEHDEALEHKRRYHRVELLGKLRDAGYHIVSHTYFVSLFAPAIIAYRTWGNIFGKSTYPKTSYVMLPKQINDLLIKALKFETKLLSKTRLPFGVTLNVVARKP
jgi:2-polyprenyl-3-methyl-5-hydroxy-6-metoxy-1,4-benzoquinol methylase